MAENKMTSVSTNINVIGYNEPQKVYYLGGNGLALLERIPDLAYEKRVAYVLERLMALEDVVTEELTPFVKEEVYAFIKENPDINTKDLNTYLFVTNDFRRRINFQAKYDLEREGKIESVKVGRGKPRTWRVKEEV